MKSKINQCLAKLCGAQETRSGTLLSVIVGAVSKPVGYLRILLLAWLFGASAGMDAYYVASGILFLCCTLIQNVLESALLPQLIRQSEQTALSLMAWAFKIVLICLGGFALAVFLFPGRIVALFVRQFDAQRLSMTSSMLLMLIPWSASLIVQSLLSVWNNYSGRYSLVITLSCLMNLLLIPSLFLLSFFLGVNAVPAAYSAVYLALTWIMWKATGDFPWRVPGRVKIPGELLRRLGADCLLCVGIVGASSLYQLVDRYFASGLPAGNISAINYAGQIYMLPLSVMAPAVMIYLNRASQMAAAGENARAYLGTVLSMGWLYLFPPSIVLVCLARPAVRFFLGYGAFDSAAVALTAPCMSAAVWALPLLLWGQFLARYAQAAGKLKTILVISYGALALNAFLDWLFVPWLGAPGLCVATGITWGGSALVYLKYLTPKLLGVILKQIWKPTAIFGGLACALLLPLAAGLWLPLSAGALLLALYFLAGERLGFFESVPEGWRPLSILGLVLKRLHP